MSDAFHDALEAKRSALAHLHPYNAPLHLQLEAPMEPERTTPAWIDFGDTEARAWSRVLLHLMPRGGRSTTTMAAASSVWQLGGLPDINHGPEVARAARALGHTPETAWEMLVTLMAVRQVQKHDPNLAYDLRVWAVWLQRMNRLDDPIEAAQRCVKAVEQP